MLNDGKMQLIEGWFLVQMALIIFKIMGLQLSWFWIWFPTWFGLLIIASIVLFVLFVGDKLLDWIKEAIKVWRRKPGTNEPENEPNED